MQNETKMSLEKLKQTIAAYWEQRAEIAPASCPQELHEALEETMSGLDSGKLRVAELNAQNEWQTNVWLKQAVLLYFRSKDMRVFSNFDLRYWDKVELKFSNWSEKEFRASGIRVVPGAIVRRGTFIDRDAVLMPSFINIGARVGKGSMIDTWATVGSCAQIGSRVHISGGAGIGGVLEPLQAAPVIIEDDCFIGARSEVAEGVRVEKGSVLSMGVFLGASTKIYDRESGETFYGRVPPYSVVVPGTLPGSKKSDAMLSAAIIVKRVDEKTRAKTEINDLLRE